MDAMGTIGRSQLAMRQAMEPKPTAPQRGQGKDQEEFRKVFHQFTGEMIFGQMVKSMRKTLDENPYFHGGRAEEIFQQQLDQVLVEKMTEATSETLSQPMFELMNAPRQL
jgi:Rod binding domain-containing protein